MPDWGDDRGDHASTPPRQPLQATAEQQATWQAMGREKFKDPEHQRFAQSHRTAESLREAGKHGYQATAERYGREYASDLLASHRRDQPTRPERELVGILKELGVEEGRDYHREYKVSPGMYADFAIPDRKLAIEVHGSAHQATFFLERGIEAREERRAETYARAGWAVQVVTDRDLREGREETQARMRETIAGATGSRR
jgi:G:T-mismatch repair DNA endonuclease (very short patch repair protein)